MTGVRDAAEWQLEKMVADDPPTPGDIDITRTTGNRAPLNAPARLPGRVLLSVVLVAVLILMAACATAPPERSAGSFPGSQSAAADIARSLVGVPYRFGGASPRGMDCSGLVQYAYREAGIRVPRTVAEQRRHSFPVSMSELQAGDLLFFRLNGRISHVGIYLGQQRFVHAPRTGKRVSITALDNSFWKKRLAGAGRFY